MSRWKNVPGSLTIDFDENNPLRLDFPFLPKKGTLEISFLSSGEFDHGRTYGPPEKCYPPEYEEYRVPRTNAVIHDDKGNSLELTLTQTQVVFEIYESEIDVVDLEFEDLDYAMLQGNILDD